MAELPKLTVTVEFAHRNILDIFVACLELVYYENIHPKELLLNLNEQGYITPNIKIKETK